MWVVLAVAGLSALTTPGPFASPPSVAPGDTGLAGGSPSATSGASPSRTYAPAVPILQNTPTPGWSRTLLTQPPSARTGAALAFDPVLGATILFGGLAGGPTNDTWTFHYGVWTQLPEATAPSPRAGASMAWDPVGGYLLLFGGSSGGAYDSDSWAFRGSGWTLLPTAAHPSARAGAGLTLDPTRGNLVLFGGTDGQPLGDTWTFTAGNWSLLAPLTRPAARSVPVFVTDPEAGSAVLFGGLSAGPLNDTWEFHDGSWFPVTSSAAPSPRGGAAGQYDETDGYLVVFGGYGTASLSDSWAFRSSEWTQLFPTDHPPATDAAGTAVDETQGTILVFGGEANGTAGGSLWAYRAAPRVTSPDPFGWTEVRPAREPTDRTQAGFAFDAADGVVVLFGGQNQSGNGTNFYNDTWTYRSGVWTQHNLTPSPAPRRGSMMVYDPSEGAIVLFGGSNSTNYYNDTWLYRHGAWTPIPTPVAPSPRRSSGFTFDPELAGLVLFGGHNGSGGVGGYYSVFNDTWLWRAGTWSKLTGGPVPEPRAEPLLTFDPTDGYAVMFGGYHQNGSAINEDELNSTWKFQGGLWTNISSSVGPTPSHRDGSGFVFDPAAGYILMFAGDDNSVKPVPTVWEFAQGRWSELCHGCAPPTWAADHAAYDAADGYLVVQGSQDLAPPTGEIPQRPGPVPGGSPSVANQRTWAWVVAPFLNATASATTTDVGLPVQLSAWYGGGTSPWNVSWDLGSGPGPEGSRVTATFSSAGNVAVLANANTTGGNSTTALPVTIVVHTSPAAVLQLSALSVTVGTSVAITIGSRNGTAPVALRLTGLPPGCPNQLSRTWDCAPTSNGTYVLSLNATDALGEVGRTNITLVVSSPAVVPKGPGRGFSTLQTYIALFGPAAVATPAAIYLLWRFGKRPPRPPAPAEAAVVGSPPRTG